ncbi:MAG: PspA/IM30 family protein [Gammaproteobacteria bacterium]|nr:PspA/IM30 family protein [Gammaproteobacteria bacterium]MDH5630511.1 PspA/IM30 family protein [Gammaproteobacteria bacterium]
MGVFKRLSDLVNSNLTAMLDKAEDPEKLLRFAINEMEDTLQQVRVEAAKIISDKKEMQRNMEQLKQEATLWEQRAEKALTNKREDLAKQALFEKNKVENAVEQQNRELTELEKVLTHLEHDIGQLQSKLDEALAKRNMMLMRHETACSLIRVKKVVNSNLVVNAIGRFNRFEKKMDDLEARIESMDMGKNYSLKNQIDELGDDKLDQALAELKNKVKNKGKAA